MQQKLSIVKDLNSHEGHSKRQSTLSETQTIETVLI